MNVRSGLSARIGQTVFISLTYLFLYLPIIILVVFSFNAEPFPAPWKGFTLRWYYELYHSVHLWNAFYVSLKVAIASVFLSVSMGLSLIYLAFCDKTVERWLQLFYINLLVPELVLAVGLLTLFTYLSVNLGLTTLIIAHTVLALGFVVPLLYSRFLDLDPRLTEASLDLGATRFQTFKRVTLPLLSPAIAAASLLVFILSFDDFILSYFCAGSTTQTLSLYIVSMLRSGVSPVINALSTLLLFFSSLLVLLFCYINVRSRIF
jgi:spermidine/putrescine transport system permease protein